MSFRLVVSICSFMIFSFLYVKQSVENVHVRCIFNRQDDTIQVTLFKDSIVFYASPNDHIYEGKWFRMLTDSVNFIVKFWIYESELIKGSDTVHFAIVCYYDECIIKSPSIGLQDRVVCKVEKNM